MTALRMLHWPWPLQETREWSQGLWRAEDADGRVLEFFATRPAGCWAEVEPLLVEQLLQALAAGTAALVSGPPLQAPPPPAPAAAAAAAAAAPACPPRQLALF